MATPINTSAAIATTPPDISTASSSIDIVKGCNTKRRVSLPQKSISCMKEVDRKVKSHLSSVNRDKEIEESRNKRLCDAFNRKGVNNKYVNLCDEDDGQFLPVARDVGVQLSESKTFVHISSKTGLTTSIPDYRRGLRAFDLALNPSVETILKTAQLSFKSDATIRCSLTPKRARPQSSTRNSKCISPAKQSPLLSSKESPTTLNDSHNLKIKLSSKTSAHSLHSESETHLHSNSVTSVTTFCGRKFQFKSARNKLKETMIANNSRHLSWLEDRLEMCSRSSSFTIPMDVLEFETMSPIEYLQRFCRVEKQRRFHYEKRLNEKIGKVTSGTITKAVLKEFLKDLLLNQVNLSEIMSFLRLIFVKDSKTGTDVDNKTVIFVAALAERILYASYANIELLETYLDPRGFLERADFSNLYLKIKNVHFTHHNLKKLLFSLA